MIFMAKTRLMKNLTRMSSGFTLVELMVTLVVVAILLAAGVPSFIDLVRANRVAAQTNLFTTAIALARNEAVKGNVSAFVCKRNVAGDDCDNAANWEDGWIVFADADSDGVLDDTEIVRVFEGLSTGYTLRNTGVFTNWIRYMPKGDVIGTKGIPAYSNTANTEVFRLCSDDADPVKGRQINIIPSGRVNLVEGTTACP